ncbi:DUF2799 domain-containing protein [Vibrio sp. TRT 17S01]|uniref:DUF2799 domain-containing protein n=1 Tax=Vibrio sp. TRT 17S01 TaxID=3418505 RepID=UPI003CF67BD2
MQRSWILVPFILVSGCMATSMHLDPEQWGERSATRGELMVQHPEALKDALKADDISAEDFARYQQGFLRGKKVFCDVNKAFTWGANGNKYQGQCDGFSTEPQFRYEAERGFERFVYPENKSFP